jgi:rare lipoprotein A
MRLAALSLFLLSLIVAHSGCGCCCCLGGGTSSERRLEYGLASYYGKDFHGRKTASGETFNMYDMTAAHKRLPFGTKVRVTNLKNGQSVVVRINDRGPFVHGRIIDLSYAAAKEIGLVEMGVTKVRVEVLN